jgi:F-type H+-transporting ATPase subunit epsilon
MADDMKLDILTPLGPRCEGVSVPGVEIPGIEGELGVLPHHEALVTAVVPGVVRYREGVKTVRLAVGAGFLEVDESGRVVILVEQAVAPDEVDAEAARRRLGQVKTEIDAYRGAAEDPEHRKLHNERGFLEAQLRLIAN